MAKSIDRRLREALKEARTKLKEKDIKDLNAGVTREQLQEIASRNPSIFNRGYKQFKGGMYEANEILGPLDLALRKSIARVYDTAEYLTRDALQVTGNIAGRALLPLAILGSVILGAEAYKPGTIERLFKEAPQVVQAAQDAFRQIYYGRESTVAPQPPYDKPTSGGAVPKR